MRKISEYGIKIKNIEAATLFEYNKGLRDHYDYKNAMLTNSLFQEFLVDNKLNVVNGSTRDIIGIEFNFGTRSFEEEKNHLVKIAHAARNEYKLAKSHGHKMQIQKKANKRRKIADLYKQAKENKNLYKKLSKDELREIFYKEGIIVPYYKYKKGKDPEIIEIKYRRLFRSTGKAKKGSCMFIREELFDISQNFIRMGIELPDKNAKIVEISAYEPLISSGIVGKIKINPENILILEDVDRFMTRDVVSIETDDEKHCHAITKEGYTLKNTLFDGQALIDSSIFPEWADGYILLRHHFCKMASFCTNIKQFFKDYFGKDYYTATVKDMFGNDHFVKDIELITTDNAMKWLKFGVSYEYWCSKVNDNNSMFGIVKTAHESKLGDVQKMSYQMVNSLDGSIMENVCSKSIEYINKLKTDNSVFLDYLKNKSNFSNDFEVLIDLVKQNPEFVRSEYFRDRKKNIIKTYVLNLKSGELIQNADNLVIVGSPYAMLLYAATGDKSSVDKDDTFSVENSVIQCYNKKFDNNEFLAFFRSPFNSKNNLTYLHNIHNEKLDKYFNLGKLCIAVNMNGTDFQDRNNGSDQDSDSGYTTNQKDIVSFAKECYIKYPTIVNNIPKDTNVYNNTMEDYARLDNQLSASQTDIGESSNLAQIAQSYACNFNDSKYQEYVCILSVIAQAAIDSAKRQFDLNISNEIHRIKKDLNVKENKYPLFWLSIKRGFNKDNINKDIKCPMNYLYNLKLNKFQSKESTLPMSNFFEKHPQDINKKTCKRVEELIVNYSLKLHEYQSSIENDDDEYLLLRSDFEDLVNSIKGMNISGKYLGLFSWLIDRAFCITPGVIRNNSRLNTKINKNKSLLLKILYDVNKDNLLKCFSKNC